MSGYHEDGQGRLSVIQQALPLTHGFLAPNHYSVGIVDEAVADVICHRGSDSFSGQPGMSNRKQKILEFACTGTPRFQINLRLLSPSGGHRSHSSIIRRGIFLILCHELADGAVAASNLELRQ